MINIILQFELGWKVLKELLRYEGANQAATGSPREIIKLHMRIMILLMRGKSLV